MLASHVVFVHPLTLCTDLRHRAGTPLGDPIEVGAAFAVLGAGPAPLRLSAVKSRVGHSEAGAGGAGMCHAAALLATHAADSLMHLRQLNPLVSSLLDSHAAAGRAAPFLPRQGGAGVLGPTAAGWVAATGVSAFAFQGTNAHVVFVQSSGLAATQPSIGTWQRRRQWFAGQPHALLARLANGKQSVQLLAPLAAPALAYLQDHRVVGRPLFPGAAMLEAGLAAAHLLLDGGSASTQPALCAASIAAPLVLPESSSRSALLLVTTIEAGNVRVSSTSAADSKGKVHLAGRLEQLAAAALPHKAAPAPADDEPSNQRTLREVVLARQRMHYPPAATAMLEHRVRDQQAGQYHVHPALIDCATQVGGALNTSGTSISRVPAGVGAFALPATARSGSHVHWHAAGALTGGQPDGAVEFGYQLAPAETASSRVQIGGMLLKPAGALQQARTAGEDQLVYGVQVQACSWAHQARSSAVPLAPSELQWQLGATAAQFAVPLRSTSASLPALVASLPLLQQAVTAPAAQPITLFSSDQLGAGSARRPASLALGGAAGLLRVAAQEHKAQQMAHVSRDSLAAFAPQLPGGLAPDIYSTDLSQGVVYTQLLVPVPPAKIVNSAAAAPTAAAFSGSVLVTGGLGDIGQLTGMWAAQTCPSARVWLLSRSGRPASHAHWLEVPGGKQAGCISAASCDAASACDLAGLQAVMLAHGAPALTSVFHAGAVLRDGLLGSQTAQTLREVYAPKVLGGALLVQATLGLPVHSMMHFSSLSAQVRGQGWCGVMSADAGFQQACALPAAGGVARPEQLRCCQRCFGGAVGRAAAQRHARVRASVGSVGQRHGAARPGHVAAL